MMKSKQLDYRLVRLRIIACLFVIGVHVSNSYLYAKDSFHSPSFLPSLIMDVICRICVPLFFMISGYLALKKPYDAKKNKKKILHFLFIVVIWSIFFYIWNKYFLHNEMLPVLSYIFDPVKNHLWYMYDLIGLYIALPFIQAMVSHLSRSLENRFIIAWLIFAGGVRFLTRFLGLFDIEADMQYYIPIIQATYHLGYFVCGYILYKRKEEFTKLPASLLCFVFILSTFCISILTYYHSAISQSFKDSFLTYGEFFIMINSIIIFLLNAKIKAGKHKVMVWLSSLTFGIYLLHPLYIDILKKILDFPEVPSWWIFPMIAAVAVVSGLCIAVMQKIPYLNKLIS